MPIEPWFTLLHAWLHDPVDKAADIRGHVARARRYARVVMADEIAEADLGGTPDYLASAYERLPMPGKNSGAPYVGPDSDGRLLMYHPLSAEGRRVAVEFDAEAAAIRLGRLVRRDMSAEQLFLTLWRCAPEEFPETPADTRCPDHSLWQHLDTTAAIAWAIRGGKGGTALLSFKISPVQPFIEASRSLRDLLSGSYLLSWLCFSAMVPVLESCGPTALVYPAMRGIPLMDWWLHQGGIDVSPHKLELGRASLPNRFLAIVPQGDAETLSTRVREAAQAAWKTAAEEVQARLKQKYDSEFPGWDRLWDAQIDSYFDFRVTWVGLAETKIPQCRDEAADANAKQVGMLADEEFARYQRAGQWQRAVELSAALMHASGQIRHIPKYKPAGDVPQKCTLFGTYEQMGPVRLSDSGRFWQKESPKGKEDSDRRCAVALVKKHAFAWHLQPKLGFDWASVQFEEMNEIGGGENGYYAMLAMDGDDMGMWLSGGKSPKVRDILHPEILAWYEGQPARRAGLDARRPVSPSLHASVSAALTKFAVKVAPGIVEEHGGKRN
jgi:CRISPR-associated protein Cmr2